MDARTHDLASLLDPTPLADFFSEHWERGPYSIRRGASEYYRGVLENRDLEEIISISDARYPAIRLAKDGAYYPPAAYTREVTVGELTFRGVPDVDRISAEYAKGATVALPALHRTWGPLAALCARLEEALDYLVHANAYITPGRAGGFTPHYDTHDILVLQIAGKKRWLIDEPTIRLPHNSQTFNPQGFTPGPRLLEIELQAGDLLYLPRGYVHSTTTSECHSAHVTLGINVYTWADVAIQLMPSCVDREEFRAALPPGFARRAELRPAMRARLAELLPGLSGDECGRCIDAFVSHVQATRPRMPARFRADVVVISADSPMQAPAVQRYRVAQSGESLLLDFEGRKYVLPMQIAATLHAMCTRPIFRIREFADGLDAEAALSFARFLQNIGFLRPAG
jgi:hypothetical protein